MTKSKLKREHGDYGQELILDLHDCDTSLFTREDIEEYLEALCKLIDMKREDLHFWDDEETPEEELAQRDPKTIGISAIQFILTSNVTIHTITPLSSAYVNIFSCKSFDGDAAAEFTASFFGGEAVTALTVVRR